MNSKMAALASSLEAELAFVVVEDEVFTSHLFYLSVF
jgi:hypothetical protein